MCQARRPPTGGTDLPRGSGRLRIHRQPPAVHGLTSFRARYDGSDRWLKSAEHCRNRREARRDSPQPTVASLLSTQPPAHTHGGESLGEFCKAALSTLLPLHLPIERGTFPAATRTDTIAGAGQVLREAVQLTTVSVQPVSANNECADRSASRNDWYVSSRTSAMPWQSARQRGRRSGPAWR